jgi:hypothetical protein
LIIVLMLLGRSVEMVGTAQQATGMKHNGIGLGRSSLEEIRIIMMSGSKLNVVLSRIRRAAPICTFLRMWDAESRRGNGGMEARCYLILITVRELET